MTATAINGASKPEPGRNRRGLAVDAHLDMGGKVRDEYSGSKLAAWLTLALTPGLGASTIRRLRTKLGDPPMIHTVREAGYRIGPE